MKSTRRYRDTNKSKFKYYAITIATASVLGIGIVLGAIQLQKTSIGEKAVMLMYDFEDAYDLDSHMKDLKRITTKEVYNELTINNADRTLNTYLKFKDNSVDVEIIKSTRNYILYRLNTESLTTNRKFMFTFDTDIWGKINYVREMEIIDFYPNLD
ncbi:hypothetical protein [uncultured Clostridium sp.]|uniref:hypothetical protein n=1 Tax=uncultured Clostridium sp. TaxID=59620 RepID=UPI0026F404DE|nr:hypothetical protein [uncultured Clostridium sp.]